MPALCRFPGGCDEKPVRGAFVLPRQPGDVVWSWARFCDEHGRLAVERGARRIAWVPKRSKARGVFPSEPLRGPIARELRRVGPYWWRLRIPDAYHVWQAAQERLGLADVDLPVSEGFGPDISSEAIEAADALGL